MRISEMNEIEDWLFEMATGTQILGREHSYEKDSELANRCLSILKEQDEKIKKLQQELIKKREVNMADSETVILLNERLDRLALVLDEIMPNCANLVRDAMELLKEQEAKKVTWRVGRAHCPSCGELFPKKQDKQYIRFCNYCGQAVKWNE